MLNDHRDHLSMAALLENRMNSQHMEHTNGKHKFHSEWRLFNTSATKLIHASPFASDNVLLILR